MPKTCDLVGESSSAAEAAVFLDDVEGRKSDPLAVSLLIALFSSHPGTAKSGVATICDNDSKRPI